VTIDDVTELIDLILKSKQVTIDNPAADVDGDGVVNVADVVKLIDMLLQEGEDPNCPWVDLGLPSRTLWAKWNIGASSPEEYGDYFCWGETAPKDTYTVFNYKWGGKPSATMKVTKYCTDSGFGIVDSLTVLEPEDDAAYVNWGPSWRMPTLDEIYELIHYCHPWQWTEMNGVYGQLGTGPNGKTIFLPAAGFRYDDIDDDDYGNGLYGAGEVGYFWSCELGPGVLSAYHLELRPQVVLWGCAQARFNGVSVRAVRN
jgi:hypothetical protein